MASIVGQAIQSTGGIWVDDRFSRAHGQIDDKLAYPRVVAYTVTEANFEDAALNETVVLGSLKAGECIWYACFDLVTVFAGGSVASATMSLGRAGDTDSLIVATNVFTGATTGLTATALASRGADLKSDIATTPAVDENLAPYLVTADENLVCRLVTTTANVNACTTGEIDFYIVIGPNLYACDKPIVVPVGN